MRSSTRSHIYTYRIFNFFCIVFSTNLENSFCLASHFVDAKKLTDVRPTQLQSFGCTKIGGENHLFSDNDGNHPKLCPIEGPWSAIAIWYYLLMWKRLKIAQMMACGWDSLLLLCLILLSSGPRLLQFSGVLGFLFSVTWRWDITTCLRWLRKSRYVPNSWLLNHIFGFEDTAPSWILRLHECVLLTFWRKWMCVRHSVYQIQRRTWMCD